MTTAGLRMTFSTFLTYTNLAHHFLKTLLYITQKKFKTLRRQTKEGIKNNSFLFAVLLLNHVQFFLDPMDCRPPGFSVPGISLEEYWGGLPFPSPGDLPNPRVETVSPALEGGFFTIEPLGKPFTFFTFSLFSVLCVCFFTDLVLSAPKVV